MTSEPTLTLLSVEDNPVQQRLNCRLLQRQGYHVVTAGSAEEGLDLLARQPIDLVLMDVVLPGINGYTATQRLRALEASQRGGAWHPVIIVTTNDTPEDWQRASDCGADDYLTKPIKPHQLSSKLSIMARLYHNYQELRRTQKIRALGQMAAGVAHDFNNILHAISGNAELLAEDAAGQPLLMESIDEIQRAGGRGRRLVEEMLLYVHDKPLQLDPLDLSEWLQEYVEELSHQLPDTITLWYTLAPGPHVRTHIGALGRVMDNLCRNALKAMPDGGVLTLSTWQTAHQAGIEVSDSGEGIAPEHLESIFDPFFTTRQVGEGTGLGLAVVDSIMQRHGGRVQVKSPPGAGTTFTLVFPVS